MKKPICAVIVMIFFLAGVNNGQGTAGTNAKYEYRYLVDMPVAGVLSKGFVGFTARNMPEGVMIAKIEAGIFENFSFGFSYGGSNVIGTGEIDWYKLPALNVKFRILNESPQVPALTIGFDSQGKGLYFDETDRYEIKSPGFFVASAKTFDFLGYTVIHGAMNYSLERDDGDKSLNFMVGVEKTIGSQVSVIAEYDFAANDNDDESLGEGDGYLNAGVRWSVGDGFTLGLDLRDLLDNKKFNSNKADRAIFVEFIKSIL